jgi:transcriptional regulator with XRE-family HTH domain
VSKKENREHNANNPFLCGRFSCITKSMISIEAEEKLKDLGERLKDFRLKRNEPQIRFAARRGVSIPTLRKLEKGDPTVAAGAWAQALWVLGRVGDLDRLLKEEKDLFERLDRGRNKKRRRASKGKAAER